MQEKANNAPGVVPDPNVNNAEVMLDPSLGEQAEEINQGGSDGEDKNAEQAPGADEPAKVSANVQNRAFWAYLDSEAAQTEFETLQNQKFKGRDGQQITNLNQYVATLPITLGKNLPKTAKLRQYMQETDSKKIKKSYTAADWKTNIVQTTVNNSPLFTANVQNTLGKMQSQFCKFLAHEDIVEMVVDQAVGDIKTKTIRDTPVDLKDFAKNSNLVFQQARPVQHTFSDLEYQIAGKSTTLAKQDVETIFSLLEKIIDNTVQNNNYVYPVGVDKDKKGDYLNSLKPLSTLLSDQQYDIATYSQYALVFSALLALVIHDRMFFQQFEKDPTTGNTKTNDEWDASIQYRFNSLYVDTQGDAKDTIDPYNRYPVDYMLYEFLTNSHNYNDKLKGKEKEFMDDILEEAGRQKLVSAYVAAIRALNKHGEYVASAFLRFKQGAKTIHPNMPLLAYAASYMVYNIVSHERIFVPKYASFTDSGFVHDRACFPNGVIEGVRQNSCRCRAPAIRDGQQPQRISYKGQ